MASVSGLSMSIYVVGDLQGCYEPFIRLLTEVNFDPAVDQLWLVGDLVNRGKQSLESLRLVRSLGKQAITVLGNHDISLITAFYGLRKLHKSLKPLSEAYDYAELVEWLAQQPILHVDTTLGYALAHAGIAPQWDLTTALSCANEVQQQLKSPLREFWLAQVYGDQPDYWDAQHATVDRHRYILNVFTRMRYCRTDGSLELETKDSPSVVAKNTEHTAKLIPWFDYPTRQPLGVTVLFGHWSTLGYYVGNQVIALDTGCVWGGRLSALRIDTNNLKLISIPCDDYG